MMIKARQVAQLPCSVILLAVYLWAQTENAAGASRALDVPTFLKA